MRELHVAIERAAEGAELCPESERLLQMADGLLLDFFTASDPIGSQSHRSAQLLREMNAEIAPGLHVAHFITQRGIASRVDSVHQSRGLATVALEQIGELQRGDAVGAEGAAGERGLHEVGNGYIGWVQR